MLYATDFHNARVDMFDSTFNVVSTATTFVDPDIPAGFAPFGIQAIGDTIFVTYAKQDADAEDEVRGKGRGFVDAFGTDGTFMGRVASRKHLNAPWGLAMAPENFGRFSGALLVGNFGDGQIHAFRATAGGSYRGGRGPVEPSREGPRDRRSVGDRVRQRRRGRPLERALLHGRPG